MIKTKCVLNIGGNYVAFHEIYMNVAYVFNVNTDYTDILEDIDDLPEDIDEYNTKELDILVNDFINDFEYDSYDLQDFMIFDCVYDEKEKKVYVDV